MTTTTTTTAPATTVAPAANTVSPRKKMTPVAAATTRALSRRLSRAAAFEALSTGKPLSPRPPQEALDDPAAEEENMAAKDKQPAQDQMVTPEPTSAQPSAIAAVSEPVVMRPEAAAAAAPAIVAADDLPAAAVVVAVSSPSSAPTAPPPPPKPKAVSLSGTWLTAKPSTSTLAYSLQQASLKPAPATTDTIASMLASLDQITNLDMQMQTYDAHGNVKHAPAPAGERKMHPALIPYVVTESEKVPCSNNFFLFKTPYNIFYFIFTTVSLNKVCSPS